MQLHVQFQNYAVRIKRSKQHKKSIFNKIDFFYIMCNKKNKIIVFKVIKQKREVSRITKCFYSILIKEKNDV